MTSRKLFLMGLAALAALSAAGRPMAAQDVPDRAQALALSCGTTGAWIDTKTGKAIAPEAFFDGLMREPIVLLGENHDSAEHHRWQLQNLAALHGRGARLVIGFEMFPRRLQPVLDRWVRGELTEKAFLDASEWRRLWGYDPELYLPLFHFARMNGIPMVALNVERALVSRVAAEGWVAVPQAEREGLTDPAPASAAYRRSLAEVYALKESFKTATPKDGQEKAASGTHGTPEKKPQVDETKLAEIEQRPEFQRFVEAQLVWDRAMAEALAAAKAQNPQAQIVGVMGAGHVEHSHGVPHQLAAAGVPAGAALIPVEAGEACGKTAQGYAHAVFTLKTLASAAEERPRLGVMLTGAENAALVTGVMPDSVAAATGLQKGDSIIRAAGIGIRGPADLTEVISRQAAGTWLPLTIRRNGEDIELIAKFAARQQQQ